MNKHYHFLRSVQTKLSLFCEKSPKNIQYEFYQKHTENDHGSKLGHKNRFLIPLCDTEIISSLRPNANGRYIGFASTDGKTVDQLNECQISDGKVFHIQEYGWMNSTVYKRTCVGDF